MKCLLHADLSLPVPKLAIDNIVTFNSDQIWPWKPYYFQKNKAKSISVQTLLKNNISYKMLESCDKTFCKIAVMG